MGVLDIRVFKRIERHFFLAEDIRDAVREARDKQLYGKPNLDNPGGSRSAMSDPTSQRGVSLADKIARIELRRGKDVEVIRRPEDWLEVVDRTTVKYKDTPLSMLMNRRYKGESIGETCNALCISNTTYKYWRNEIITTAGLYAVQIGLIKIF